MAATDPVPWARENSGRLPHRSPPRKGKTNGTVKTGVVDPGVNYFDLTCKKKQGMDPTLK